MLLAFLTVALHTAGLANTLDLFVTSINPYVVGKYTTSGATVNSALINLSNLREPQFIAALPVPEPSTFVILGAGLLPVIGTIRRRYSNR